MHDAEAEKISFGITVSEAFMPLAKGCKRVHSKASFLVAYGKWRIFYMDSQGETDSIDEHTSLRKAIGERLINWESLNSSGRWLIRLTVLQLFVVLAVIAFHGYLGPLVQLGNDQTIPGFVIVLIQALLVLGVSVLLAGALHSHWFFRLFSLSLITFLQINIVLGMNSLDFSTLFQGSLPSSLEDVSLGAIAVPWLWGIGVWAMMRRGKRLGKDLTARRSRSLSITFIVMLVLQVLFVAANYFRYVDTNSSGQFPVTIDDGLVFLWVFLVPVFIVSGSDYAELGEEIGNRLTSERENRHHWVLFGLILLVSVITIVFETFVVGFSADDLLGALVLTPFIALICAIVVEVFVRIGHIQNWKFRKVPFRLIILGVPFAILWFALWLILSTYVFTDSLSAALVYAAALVIVSIPLMIIARWQKNMFGIAVTFYFLIGSIGILQFYGGLIEYFLAFVTVFILITLLLGRRINKEYVPFLNALLILNASLLCLAFIFFLFLGIQSVGSQLSILAGLLLIFALTWDLMTSGDEITNRNSEGFPRLARIYLYVSYVILASALTAYFASRGTVSNQTGNDSLDFLFDPHTWARIGIQVLGVPVILTMFLIHVAHWRSHMIDKRKANRQAKRAPRTL
jgi:hypothetical protein